MRAAVAWPSEQPLQDAEGHTGAVSNVARTTLPLRLHSLLHSNKKSASTHQWGRLISEPSWLRFSLAAVSLA